MKIDYIEGQTPIDEDELEALKLTHITTVDELNIWELKNIQEAESWAQKQANQDVLDDYYLRKLHKQMFCNVWTWAGKYRTTNKNIGVDKTMVPTEVKKLLDDVKIWIECNTFEAHEIATRFHHGLVSIHPFPNGNGRHARLMTDILISKTPEIRPLTWGCNQDLTVKGDTRSNYIAALRAADQGDITPLIKFTRS